MIAWVREFSKKDLGIEVDRPIVELDEMWTFVRVRKNEVWIWLALEVNSRKVLTYAVGDRSVCTFKKLWDGLDKIKRKISYTDRRDAYNLIPYKQRIVKKKKTNYIERLFLTLRNDNPRFSRKSDPLNLSKCSKDPSNCESITITHQQYHSITVSHFLIDA